MEANKVREAPPPEGLNDPDCEAILATRTKAQDEQGIKSAAKGAHGKALEAEELSDQDLGGNPYVGDRRSPGFAGLSELTRVLEVEV